MGAKREISFYALILNLTISVNKKRIFFFLQLCLFCLTFVFGLAVAFPQVPVPGPKSGGYAPDHYFQYINVPKHKVYEWGYKRGNKDHFREEYLSQKDHTFKAKVSRRVIYSSSLRK